MWTRVRDSITNMSACDVIVTRAFHSTSVNSSVTLNDDGDDGIDAIDDELAAILMDWNCMSLQNSIEDEEDDESPPSVAETASTSSFISSSSSSFYTALSSNDEDTRGSRNFLDESLRSTISVGRSLKVGLKKGCSASQCTNRWEERESWGHFIDVE